MYVDEGSLFGREWLLAHKAEPPSSGVSLLRCHYRHNASDDFDPSAPDAPVKVMTGDLVPPPSAITDGIEVQRILLSLPDSSDLGHRCIGPEIDDFDEFTVLDLSGTPVAKFQTSEHGSCGIFRVVPAI